MTKKHMYFVRIGHGGFYHSSNILCLEHGIWNELLMFESRAPERWDRWEHGPSQFEILAATFGYPAKITVDNKWLPVKNSYHRLWLPAKNVVKPKNANKDA